ncbi:MAG: hypothetical protein ABWZ80_02360 [Beijerinckiaceae bacterium]
MATGDRKGGGKMGAAPGRDARSERLAAALRENLKRRKAQSRGRAEAAEGDPSGPDQTIPGTPPRKP